VAWVQRDIKKLVAYSSVSHLGFCILGLMALNVIGVSGSVLYMINHGLSTGALFLVVGMIYERYHTRDINELSGLAKKMPILAFFFVLFALASIGLPGLNGFVNEFLTILGAFTANHLGPCYGAFAALGIILGALYILHMVARVIWGPLKVPEHINHSGEAEPAEPLPPDLNAREIAILVPLALAVIILGVQPNLILKSIEKPVDAMVQAEDHVSPTASSGQFTRNTDMRVSSYLTKAYDKNPPAHVGPVGVPQRVWRGGGRGLRASSTPSNTK
jgi:NADH-quinone oxidoreductase subunit M